MYNVMCRSPRCGMRWVNYGGPYQTIEKAQAVKERAEARHSVDLYGNELLYKIVEVSVNV